MSFDFPGFLEAIDFHLTYQNSLVSDSKEDGLRRISLLHLRSLRLYANIEYGVKIKVRGLRSLSVVNGS